MHSGFCWNLTISNSLRITLLFRFSLLLLLSLGLLWVLSFEYCSILGRLVDLCSFGEIFLLRFSFGVLALTFLFSAFRLHWLYSSFELILFELSFSSSWALSLGLVIELCLSGWLLSFVSQVDCWALSLRLVIELCLSGWLLSFVSHCWALSLGWLLSFVSRAGCWALSLLVERWLMIDLFI